jgi:nucleoside-triphosphatase THEP1
MRFYKGLENEQKNKDIPFKNVIITGPPEAGKTTIMQKLVELLDTLKGEVCYTGFSAVETRFGVVRQGFRIIPLGDAVDAVSPWTLSHMNYTDSPYTVSKYGVDVETYDKNIPHCFKFRDSSSNLLPVVLIDEIGMMECYSDVFRREVEKALDDPDLVVIATAGQRGNKFMERIRQRDDVRLIVLTSVADAIREDIPQELYSNIVDLLEDVSDTEEKEETQNIDQDVDQGGKQLEQGKKGQLEQGKMEQGNQNQGLTKESEQGIKGQGNQNQGGTKGSEQGTKGQGKSESSGLENRTAQLGLQDTA